MARIRTIKPEFFTDEDIAELSPLARLFFIGLWCHCDKEGRAKDKPRQLGARILPYHTSGEAAKALDALVSAGFVIRYQVDDESYLQVRTWLKHQRPHHTEQDSVLPPLDNGVRTVQERTEGKGREGKGKERKEHSCSSDDEQDGKPAKQYTIEFEAWWQAYPRKIGKRKAFQEFQRALKRTTLEILRSRVAEFAKSVCGKEPQYIVYPERWLSRGQWDDDLNGESRHERPSPGSKHDPEHPVTPL